MNIEDLQLEVRKLVPEDGDVLMLKSKRMLPMAVRRGLADMLDNLGHRIGKDIQFVILDDGLDLEVLKTSRLADLRPQQVAA